MSTLKNIMRILWVTTENYLSESGMKEEQWSWDYLIFSYF